MSILEDPDRLLSICDEFRVQPKKKRQVVEKKQNQVQEQEEIKIEEKHDMDMEMDEKHNQIEELDTLKHKVTQHFAQMEIVHTEPFNQDKLWYCLSHPDECFLSKKSHFGGEKDEEEDEREIQIKIASDYLSDSVKINGEGNIQVHYDQKNDGRMYARRSRSMQSMQRNIRHTIADGKWFDIDMKNAGPVILEGLCKQISDNLHRSKRIVTTQLSAYNQNREELLKTLDPDRDVAKEMINAIMFGGISFDDLEDKPNWIKEFKKEMKDIRMVLAHTHKIGEFVRFKFDREQEGKKTTNAEASFLCKHVRIVENKILQAALKFVGSPKECVRCYDGMMLRFLPDLDKLNNHLSGMFEFRIDFINKPMSSALTLPENIPKYYPPAICPAFDYTDPYTYSDFEKQFSTKVFDSYKQLKEELDKNFPRVLGKCRKGDNSFFKKLDDDVLDKCTSLKECGFIMSYIEKDPEKMEKKDKGKDFVVIQTTLHHFMQPKRGCEGFECIMNPEKCNPKKFNIWGGFQAIRTTAKPPGLKTVTDFIKEVICSNDKHRWNYIMSWCRGLVANVDSINKTALILQSIPGTGKGHFVTLLRRMLGGRNTWIANGLDQVVKNAANIENKRLVAVEEMSSVWEEMKPNFNKLKHYITDSPISIRDLYIKLYMIENISNWIFLSNHKDAFVIEQGDRRYNCIDVSEAHLNDWGYFGKLEKEFENQEVIDAFYTALMDAPDFEIVPLHKLLTTELRSQMQQLSKPSTLKFLEKRIENQPHFAIGCGELYEEFVRWCGTCTEHKVSNTRFALLLKDARDTKNKPMLVKGGPKVRFYHTPEWVGAYPATIPKKIDCYGKPVFTQPGWWE